MSSMEMFWEGKDQFLAMQEAKMEDLWDDSWRKHNQAARKVYAERSAQDARRVDIPRSDSKTTNESQASTSKPSSGKPKNKNFGSGNKDKLGKDRPEEKLPSKNKTTVKCWRDVPLRGDAPVFVPRSDKHENREPATSTGNKNIRRG